MRRIYILSIVFVLSLLASNNSFGEEVGEEFEVKKELLVIDNAKVFSDTEVASLTTKLNQFSKQTSTQILVYTTSDLGGYDVADYGQRLGEKLGVGTKGFDNGIVIVFKPKMGNSPGRVTIQTGYGIEPLIPDVTANQIINNEMIPSFKQGQVYQGINSAIDICMSLTKGEFTAEQYEETTAGRSGLGGLVMLFIFGIVFFSIFKKSSGSYNTGSRSSFPLLMTMLLMGGGSSRGSGFGDFSSGSGSFGGGGFGGFGGGGFGGGGASGSW